MIQRGAHLKKDETKTPKMTALVLLLWWNPCLGYVSTICVVITAAYSILFKMAALPMRNTWATIIEDSLF